MKIKTGDKIRIIAGKDKGKTGKVLQVFPREKKISVEGLNILIKHLRPRRRGDKGQRIEFPASFDISNAMLVCPQCGRAGRVGFKLIEKGKKVRVCSKCKQPLE